jgi:hypothetical protein
VLPATLAISSQATVAGGIVIFKNPLTANLFIGGPPLVLQEEIAGVPFEPGAGAYTVEVQFPREMVGVTVEQGAFLEQNGRVVECSSSQDKKGVRLACASTGSGSGAGGRGVLAEFVVQPAPGVRIRPDVGNEMLVQIHNVPIKVVTVDGTELNIQFIFDAVVAVRALEGDITRDCRVNLIDWQSVAFRFGSTFGSLWYDEFFDLQPTGGDDDVDIKDLQFVIGRTGSSCDDPTPPQPSPTPVTTPVIPTVSPIATGSPVPGRTSTPRPTNTSTPSPTGSPSPTPTLVDVVAGATPTTTTPGVPSDLPPSGSGGWHDFRRSPFGILIILEALGVILFVAGRRRIQKSATRQ